MSTSILPPELQAAIAQAVREELRAALAPQAGPEFLTVKQAMARLCLSHSELYRRFAAGDLPMVKRGNRTLIPYSAIIRYAERLRRGSP